MTEIVELVKGLPAWMLAHPWAFAGWAVLTMSAMASAILLNPNGRQVRDLFRRRR